KNLVDLCNRIVAESGFEGLSFVQGSISDYPVGKIDMLIALHACDTATDDAIFKGISADATYIICAPCCHHQIRKEMNPENELKPILKHGIFLERQAEMLTDGLRALILEKYGYHAKVFEFISTSHTPKNVIIVGRKTKIKPDVDKISDQIHQIKRAFGIGNHYLEQLLNKTEAGSWQ
ncbi:MAG: methyltransferase, partial [Patescibacteria group bacterium]